MRIGASFPTTAIGHDSGAIREFVQTAEGLGYDHIRVLDHVMGADPAYHPEVPQFYYTHESVIREPFTLMGYMAALTTRVELVTGILILPQRQTALVAKQAAEVDVLSGGRLRLGIGVGWNPVEFEALGEDFRNRGQRMEEQIEVLRLLWTHDVVDYHGKWHNITSAGINPLPVQRPIPIWIGAGAPASAVPPRTALRRIGRLADGFFTLCPPDDTCREVLANAKKYAAEAGRDPAELQIEGRIELTGGPEDWLGQVKAWEELEVEAISVGTARTSLSSPDEHIGALKRFREIL